MTPLRLEIEKGTTGLWFVTSPDVRGLLISGLTPDAALAAVPGALRDLAAAAPCLPSKWPHTKNFEHIWRH